MAREPVRVLGVDTSLRSSGVGVIEAGGSMTCLLYDVIRNPSSRRHSHALQHLQRSLCDVIEKTKPDVAAVEGVFYCKNARTSLILGQARGVVLAACAAADLEVYEYAPRLVKQSLVGVGSAQKSQVARMVMQLLGLKEQPPEDAADALGIAITHVHRQTGHTALDTKPI